MELDQTAIKKWWNILLDGYRESSIFMMDQGILSESILPYSTMIIPLSAIFADINNRKGEINAKAAWSKIRQWYWCSVFGQRYSGPVETYSALDFEQVVEWVDGGPEPEAVRTFIFRSDALQEISSIRSAMYKGVLCLLAQNGAKDFSGGGKMNINLFHDTHQDHHHIFPTEALKQLGIDDPRANTIVNKTLISATANRSISGRKPSSYVQIWRNRLDADAFDDILTSHGINPDLLSQDNWQEFVMDRRERLCHMIESVCKGAFQPFTNSFEMESQEEEEDQQEPQ
jgi:hypothetical protein